MDDVLAAELEALPPGLLDLTGQASLDAWNIGDALEAMGWSRYEFCMTREDGLIIHRLRELVEDFPTWQHRNGLGRPQLGERNVLFGLLLRQFKRTTFRGVESFMRFAQDFLRLDHVPDASTMSRKNNSERFRLLLRRFHYFVLEQLPRRKAIIATDATGFGNDKRSWRDTPYAYRAQTGRYVKANCAVEVPQRLILSPVLTAGRRFESLSFEQVWDNLPRNVQPIRSVADSAYSGQPCLEVVKAHGATPIHSLPKNARYRAKPGIDRDQMVNFATHFPNRFAKLKAIRALVETTFSNLKELYGDRIRCRSVMGRRSEIWAKISVLNVRTITFRQILSGEFELAGPRAAA